jgi:hypothetical protein
MTFSERGNARADAGRRIPALTWSAAAHGGAAAEPAAVRSALARIARVPGIIHTLARAGAGDCRDAPAKDGLRHADRTRRRPSCDALGAVRAQHRGAGVLRLAARKLEYASPGLARGLRTGNAAIAALAAGGADYRTIRVLLAALELRFGGRARDLRVSLWVSFIHRAARDDAGQDNCHQQNAPASPRGNMGRNENKAVSHIELLLLRGPHRLTRWSSGRCRTVWHFLRSALLQG